MWLATFSNTPLAAFLGGPVVNNELQKAETCCREDSNNL